MSCQVYYTGKPWNQFFKGKGAQAGYCKTTAIKQFVSSLPYLSGSFTYGVLATRKAGQNRRRNGGHGPWQGFHINLDRKCILQANVLAAAAAAAKLGLDKISNADADLAESKNL